MYLSNVLRGLPFLADYSGLKTPKKNACDGNEFGPTELRFVTDESIRKSERFSGAGNLSPTRNEF